MKYSYLNMQILCRPSNLKNPFFYIAYDSLPVVFLFTQVLSPVNMVSRFSALLWLEELQAENEMREFNINGALLNKGAGYLHLEVLGLAEGKPSLNIGEEALL